MSISRRAAVAGAVSLPAAAFAQSLPPMDAGVAANIALVRRHHDLMNSGDWRAAAEIYAPDALNHGRPVGRAGILAVLGDIYATFPDWRMEIVEAVGMGDTVVARLNVSGTHRGVARRRVNGGFLVGVPPTGQRFDVQHIHWYGVRDGLFVRHWAERDDIDMMRQLGLPLAVAKA
jgi:predicted ester cyclase